MCGNAKSTGRRLWFRIRTWSRDGASTDGCAGPSGDHRSCTAVLSHTPSTRGPTARIALDVRSAVRSGPRVKGRGFESPGNTGRLGGPIQFAEGAGQRCHLDSACVAVAECSSTLGRASVISSGRGGWCGSGYDRGGGDLGHRQVGAADPADGAEGVLRKLVETLNSTDQSTSSWTRCAERKRACPTPTTTWLGCGRTCCSCCLQYSGRCPPIWCRSSKPTPPVGRSGAEVVRCARQPLPASPGREDPLVVGGTGTADRGSITVAATRNTPEWTLARTRVGTDHDGRRATRVSPPTVEYLSQAVRPPPPLAPRLPGADLRQASTYQA